MLDFNTRVQKTSYCKTAIAKYPLNGVDGGLWEKIRTFFEKNLRNSGKHIAKFRNKVYYIINGICRLLA